MVFTSSSSAVAHKVVARHGNLSVRLRVGEHRGWAALNDQLCGRCTVGLAPVVAGLWPVQHGAFPVLDLHAGEGHELIRPYTEHTYMHQNIHTYNHAK